MPDSRVNGTIFATLDESPLYKFMDLEDIDRMFDATAGKKPNGEVTLAYIYYILHDKLSLSLWDVKIVLMFTEFVCRNSQYRWITGVNENVKLTTRVEY